MNSNQRSLEEIENTMAQVASDLEDLRERRAVRVFQYEQKEQVLHQRINKLDQRWIKRRSERKPHEYAEAMEKLQGKEKLIPSRVIRQQADLCRSFHLLEVLEQDVDRIKDQHVEIIIFLHQQIKEMHEEKDKLELDYMNKLCIAEGALNEVRENRGNLMRKQSFDWAEKEESTLATLEEDSGEEDFEPVPLERPTIMRGIRTMMWGSFRRNKNAATPLQVSAAPATIKTQEKRRRKPSTAFAPPPPRNNSREMKTCDRQHMVELLMA